jgi:hypothetical protein
MQDTISIQLPGEFKPLTNLPISKVSSHVLHVNPNDYEMKVVIEVLFKSGSKLLTIRSHVVVVNETNHALDVRFAHPQLPPIETKLGLFDLCVCLFVCLFVCLLACLLFCLVIILSTFDIFI